MELTVLEADLVCRQRELRPLVDDFIRIAYRERRHKEAFEKYVALDLIEHNPDFGDGRYSAAKFIAERHAGHNTEEYLPIEQWRVEFDQVLLHGDLLIMRRHAFQRRDDAGRVFCDFWRWEGQLIVEHWDIIQDVPQGKVNPRTMW
jgi:predicted SnoaL-like aldol condensation-catalyzing enzyme